MHSLQYSGEESMTMPSAVPLKPNLLARKISFRLSGWSLNHLPMTSSLSP